MTDPNFIEHCFQPINLPFTALFIGMLLYWLLFIIGAVGLDAFDIDLDVDVGGDGDVGGVDVDGDVDVGGAEGTHGAYVSILRFFNVGDVPLMVLITFLVISLWAATIITSYYFNDTMSGLVALLWLVPNLIVSLFLVKVFSTPLKHLFIRLNANDDARVQIVGKTCIITTGEVTQSFGEAQVSHPNGPPIMLHVRSKPNQRPLGKGDTAVVVSHDEEENTYVVVPSDLEMKK